MLEFTAETIEQVLNTWRSNAAGLSAGINQAFSVSHQIAVGESSPWKTAQSPDELKSSGLLVGWQLAGRSLLLAIPATFPIPDWMLHPSEFDRSRLEVQWAEWSMLLFPAGMASDRTVEIHCPVLLTEILACGIGDDALLIPWRLFAEGTMPDSGEPAATFWIIWPAHEIPVRAEETSTEAAPSKPAPIPADHKPAGKLRSPSARQLKDLPVPVIVRLAEKRIRLGQLMSLGPGAIVTFEKSCEDLLDLCVNNQVYCRGEAVKVGEKFGLKINEVGVSQADLDAMAGPRVL